MGKKKTKKQKQKTKRKEYSYYPKYKQPYITRHVSRVLILECQLCRRLAKITLCNISVAKL